MSIKLTSLQKYLSAFICILVVVLLFLSFRSYNVRNKSRPDGDHCTIENITFTQKEDADAPIGIINEYCFSLDEIGHADTLAFYINHHNIEVYLAEELVYSMTGIENNFRTVGGNWVMIPLYESDSGKEVRVVLFPLYSDYTDKQPDFLVGSELSIYKTVLNNVLPEFLLCLCVVLTGIFLLCLATYYSRKYYFIHRLYAVGVLSISVGIWRFTYGRFCYLFFEDHTVLIYTLSIISLMFTALSMLNCVETKNEEKWERLVGVLSIIYEVIYGIQLLLQAVGLLDLRQTLRVIHGTIISSAAVLCVSAAYSWIQSKKRHIGFLQWNDSWLLGIGAIVDLLLYYFAKTSVGMLFMLGAILCYSLIEGIRILIQFADQKNALEEMETKLVLSRTMTMMSQIRSHFVFNILNAISGMCKYDPAMADDTVVRFARYLRNNIDIMSEDKNIPFTQDLKQLEDYVALEQVRFGDKIEFYTDVEVDDFMIPPLILQPVVENAIKHGVSKKETAGTIILKTCQDGENIIITVEDDGVGFDMKELEKETSVGLKNISFRLQHLVKGTFAIESKINEGTLVTITIPNKNMLKQDQTEEERWIRKREVRRSQIRGNKKVK